MDVSFQLYSAREFTPWADVFSMLAGLGYRQVEGFGGNYEDPAATRALLEQNGLTMPSGHFFPIGNFEDAIDTTLATAKTLGMTHLFCPAPEDDLRAGGDAAAWIAYARRLEDAGKKVCRYCKNGSNPVAMILARQNSPALVKLIKQVDAATLKISNKKTDKWGKPCTINQPDKTGQ